MMKKDFVELECLNGKRFLFENKWENIYDLVERNRYFLPWSSKFPFISIKKHRYCTFKFKIDHIYNTLESLFDKRYNANCNLSQLAFLFDVDFKEFDITMMNHDVMNP